MKNLCQIEELGLSCMGCCGHDYTSRKDIEDGIKRNTLSFLEVVENSTEDNLHNNMISWGKRKESKVRACGICFNLIKKEEDVFCPLHPFRNDGKELRDSFCDRSYLCKTMFLFNNEWDEHKQNKFMKFIKNKTEKNQLDWYTYSIGMDDDSLLEEFEKLN